MTPAEQKVHERMERAANLRRLKASRLIDRATEALRSGLLTSERLLKEAIRIDPPRGEARVAMKSALATIRALVAAVALGRD